MTDETAGPPVHEHGDGAEGPLSFGGRVGRTFAGSEGWWPERPVAPAGAPNVVVMLADDLGFADLGCYGSEIATPNLDALAARGIRYTNFHVTPMCSPTRSSLLTGLDHHRAGFGTVAHVDAGFPGYAMELPDDAATLPEILRDHGYATLMVGKWHLAKDSDCSAAGPQHSWPCQRGFDRFFGFLSAGTRTQQTSSALPMSIAATLAMICSSSWVSASMILFISSQRGPSDHRSGRPWGSPGKQNLIRVLDKRNNEGPTA
jgi:arylsulfatase